MCAIARDALQKDEIQILPYYIFLFAGQSTDKYIALFIIKISKLHVKMCYLRIATVHHSILSVYF